MSEFLQVQQAKIRTLSPLHIGTGEDFSPVNYVITSAKKLGLFHTLVLGTVMGENVHKIKTIVENGHGKDMIFDLQQLIHSYKEELKTHLYRRIEVSQGFYDFYENRIKGDNKLLLIRTTIIRLLQVAPLKERLERLSLIFMLTPPNMHTRFYPKTCCIMNMMSLKIFFNCCVLATRLHPQSTKPSIHALHSLLIKNAMT